MLRGISVLGIGLSLALGAAGCNGDSASSGGGGGALDGTYVVDSVTCNTTTVAPGATSQMLLIQGSTGSWITTYSDGCVKTEGKVYAYPSATSLLMQKVSIVCSGNTSACTTNSECAAQSITGPDLTYGFATSGTTVTLSRVSDGQDACTINQTTTISLTKQ